MNHSLPQLPYPYNALEPHIDAQTMEIHHSKHHQTYITNYTKLLDGSGLLEKYSAEELLLKYLEEVPAEKKQGVINNLGGHINHSFFWTILWPNCGGNPDGKLSEAINTTFGSFEAFQEAFTAKALSVFWSGWAWLGLDKSTLVITSTAGQNSPLSEWITPVIGIDVWEHAYYLKHQNKRADYIKSFWNVVNWKQAEKNFA